MKQTNTWFNTRDVRHLPCPKCGTPIHTRVEFSINGWIAKCSCTRTSGDSEKEALENHRRERNEIDC